MTCEELQARYLTGDLDETVSGHLVGCPACRSAAPGLDRLRSQLADPRVWDDPPAGLADRVVTAIQGEAGSDRGWVARVKRLAAGAAAALVVIAGVAVFDTWSSRPDWQIELDPVGDPTVSATVAGWNTATGTRMEMEISGLEPAGDGYYEIWLTSADGRHVSAGSFSDSGTVTAWAAVRRADFPRIWITLEPVDDDLGPSGAVVLDTDL